MSRQADSAITHWLRAVSAAGGICGSSADHPSYGPGFRAAHERAGHTVTRHSVSELQAEHYAREADREAAARPQVEEIDVDEFVRRERGNWEGVTDAVAWVRERREDAEPDADLPAVGTQVQADRGEGVVLALLAFPAGHDYAGRRAVQVRYQDGEGLVWPGQWQAARPAPDPVPEVAPVLVETRTAVYVQGGLF